MRFAVIADTHFFAKGGRKDEVWWNRTLRSQTARIGSCMVDTIARMEPEFVIHCGDITGYCDLANYHAALEIMDRLPCPWYAVVGNHDTWFPGVRDAFADRNGLPHGQCYYSVALNHLRFIFLDTCYWRAVDGSVAPYLDKELFANDMIEGLYLADKEMEWLGSELEKHRDEPVILASHAPLGFKDAYPVTTLPDGQPGAPGGCSLLEFNKKCGRIGDIFNRREVRKLLAAHSNVRMALAGHCHINDFHEEDALAFMQTGSMLEYPFEFRMVQVENGLASVTTHGLDNPSFQAESYMTERGNRWVAGTDTERTFSFSL